MLQCTLFSHTMVNLCILSATVADVGYIVIYSLQAGGNALPQHQI